MLSTCENYLEISGPPKKLVFEEFYSSYFILKHLMCSHIHKNLFFKSLYQIVILAQEMLINNANWPHFLSSAKQFPFSCKFSISMRE